MSLHAPYCRCADCIDRENRPQHDNPNMTNPTNQASGVAEPDDERAPSTGPMLPGGVSALFMKAMRFSGDVKKSKDDTYSITLTDAQLEALFLANSLQSVPEIPSDAALLRLAESIEVESLDELSGARWRRKFAEGILGAPPVVQPAPETAADQMLGRYAEQADEIKELLDAHAPHTTGNILARVAQLLLVQPASPAVEVASEPVLSVKRSEWEVLSPEAQAKLLAITGAASRNLKRARAAADVLDKPLCTHPPEGWTCSRGAGHEGPCASSPAQAPSTGAVDSKQWTLTSPDGKCWTGETKLKCMAAELNDRVPASVQLERIFTSVEKSRADDERLCHETYDNTFHKITATIGYDDWRMVWFKALEAIDRTATPKEYAS